MVQAQDLDSLTLFFKTLIMGERGTYLESLILRIKFYNNYNVNYLYYFESQQLLTIKENNENNYFHSLYKHKICNSKKILIMITVNFILTYLYFVFMPQPLCAANI